MINAFAADPADLFKIDFDTLAQTTLANSELKLKKKKLIIKDNTEIISEANNNFEDMVEDKEFYLSKPTMDKCKKIVAVGDLDWEPYTSIKDNKLSGIGLELIKQIFIELDLPVKEIEFADKRSIYHGLRLGDIDVLVSTYLDKELASFVDIIEPGYQVDPIMLLKRKGDGAGLRRWDDLIGQRGITTENFVLEQKFADYAHRYLYIHQYGDLNTTVDALKNNKADYMVGSKLQLEQILNMNNNIDQLELVNNLSSSAEVHMGFAKRSACKVYQPFLRKRLLELKEAGEINNHIQAYVNSQKKLNIENLPKEPESTFPLPVPLPEKPINKPQRPINAKNKAKQMVIKDLHKNKTMQTKTDDFDYLLGL